MLDRGRLRDRRSRARRAACSPARLSEDPDVERAPAGGGRPRHRGRAPRAGDVPARRSSPSLDWDLLGEEEPGLGGRRLYLPRGRVIGGSSSINAMIYLRGNRADFDDWAAQRRDGLVATTRCSRTSSAPRTTSAARTSSTASAARSPCPTAARCTRSSTRSSRLRSQAGYEHIDDLNVDRPEGVVALPAHAAERHALQRRRRVPPPGRGPAEPRGDVRRLRRADRLRGRPRRRRRARPRRRARDRARRARGDRLRRHLPVAGAADALGDRPARPSSEPFGIPVRAGPAGRPQPPGPLHGQRQLPHRPAGALRDLHARELRAARERGPRAADLELPGGGRLLPHAVGPAGAGRRVPLRRRAVLRRGPHAAARQRLRVRAR